MENREKRKTTTSKKNLFSYFHKVQKQDSSRERNEIEEEANRVDLSNASSHKVVDMSTTYVQENCIENEVNLASDVEGLVDLTKEYEETRRPNKRKRGNWDFGRSFQLEWISTFPFMEPVICENGDVIEVKCTICSWRYGRDVTMQLKKDTIEKHCGKIYYKEEVDGKVENKSRWKTAKECKHVENAEMYEKNIGNDRSKKMKGSLHSLFKEMLSTEMQSKIVQMGTIFHILKLGRPMKDYVHYKDLLNFLSIPKFPSSHWSINSGWVFLKHMAEVLRQDLGETIKNADFFSLSLDEVTAVDTSSWICMNVYTVQNHVRNVHFLSLCKMKESATAENLYNIVMNTLCEVSGLDGLDIARKLVCFGADGASVMQGNRNGLCVRLQTSIAPYMIGIHCMAHRTNLAFKILSKERLVNKVDMLVDDLHGFFCRSSKRIIEFKNFAAGLTSGKKILKNVETRWISLYEPVKRVYDEYISLVGFMAEHCFSVDKAQVLLHQLTDVETLLTLCGILPLLHQMYMLIKIVQTRTLYLAEYTKARKMACLLLDNLYITPTEAFDSIDFTKWKELIDLQNPQNFLKLDENNCVCISVRDNLVPLHILQKHGRIIKEKRVTRDEFQVVIQAIKSNLTSVARALTTEIRERFPRDELLEAMSIVYPQFWNHTLDKEVIFSEFKKNIQILIDYYCHTHVIEEQHINGILDADKLCSQAKCFVNTMMEQFGKLEDPLSNGSITRLWEKLDRSDTLKKHMSEYFKLVDLCQTMILGSIEDERIFSLVSFLKSKLRNRLDNNLISCVRLYVSNYDVNNFPYERALALWTSECSRRAGSNMTGSLKDFDSEYELDDEDSFDKSEGLSFDHLSDLEDETNTWNF